MEHRLNLLIICLALFVPALTVQSGLADNWASIQRFEPSEKSLKRRFWNDDLEPCIMKYCLRHQMETRLYMKCIRRHCPSGLVTVPRDLEREMGSLLKEAAGADGTGAGGWGQGAGKAPKVNQVCAKLYCGYIQNEAVRERCARDTCSVDKLPAGIENALDESPAPFWKWLAARVHVGGEGLAGDDGEGAGEEGGTQEEEGRSLEEATRRRVGLGQLCGLVLCAGRHGADFVSCVEERCPRPAVPADRTGRSALSATTADEEDITTDGTHHHHNPQNTVDVRRRASLTGSGGEAALDDPERTLKRKRRINDDVSQCIQSYCGRQGSRTARLACIVRACHRSG